MTGKTRNRRSLLRCPGVFCLFWPSNIIQFILQTENGGSSTFAGVFDPGRGRIGPALLKVRLVFFFARRIQPRLAFLHEMSFFFFRSTAVPQNQCWALFLSEKFAIFSDETAI